MHSRFLPRVFHSPGVRSAAKGAAGGPSRRAQLGEVRNCLVARGLGLLGLRPRWPGAFGILTYHRVAPPVAPFSTPTWNVSPARFEAQLSGLMARGYRPWPLRRLLACQHAMQPVPSKTFVITFDDGYQSVYQNAYPLLREYGVPATLFLATAYLDSPGPFPFDDWPEAGDSRVPSAMWRPLRSAECEEMLAGGLIELGTHTHVHADFRGRPQELRADLAVSMEVLRARFGIAEASLALPYGYGCRQNDGPELAQAAKEAGVLCALTADSELVRLGDDPFNWPRFGALDTDTVASLETKLDGRYSLARSAWRWLRRGGKRHGVRPDGDLDASGHDWPRSARAKEADACKC